MNATWSRPGKEVTGEGDQFLLRQRSASVVVVATREIGIVQPRVVSLVAAREPAHRRPETTGEAGPHQEQVGVQSGGAAVAIDEGVHPREAVMRAGDPDDEMLGAAESVVAGAPRRPSAPGRRRRAARRGARL